MSDDGSAVHDGMVLEMTGADQLRPAARVASLTVRTVSPDTASLIGRLYREIWDPLGGSGRSRWDADRWRDELGQPGMCTSLAEIDDQPVGFAQVHWRDDGSVGIVVFGIVPAYQGRGLGGDFLTRLVREAWSSTTASGGSTHRVWLWTNPDEHPNTVPSYVARGFRRTADIGGP